MALNTVKSNRINQGDDFNFTGALQKNGVDVVTTATTGIDAANIADGSVSNAEFQYMNGVTSNVQTQLNAKDTAIALKADAGANSDITSLTALSTPLSIPQGGTGQATANAALNAFLPTQTGNSGKFLTTNGTNSSWGTPTVINVDYAFIASTATSVDDLSINNSRTKIAGSNGATPYSGNILNSKYIAGAGVLSITGDYGLTPIYDGSTYYWVATVSGTPDTWYRYDDDLTNETVLTSTGATDVTSVSAPNAFDHTTNELLWLDALATTTIRRYTLSGTTIADAGTATYTLAAATNSARQLIYASSTHIYILDFVTPDYYLKKFAKSDGSLVSSTLVGDDRQPLFVVDRSRGKLYTCSEGTAAGAGAGILFDCSDLIDQ